MSQAMTAQSTRATTLRTTSSVSSELSRVPLRFVLARVPIRRAGIPDCMGVPLAKVIDAVAAGNLFYRPPREECLSGSVCLNATVTGVTPKRLGGEAAGVRVVLEPGPRALVAVLGAARVGPAGAGLRIALGLALLVP